MNGSKTYLTALATIIGTGAAWYLGELPTTEAVQLVIGAIFAATIRHGISTGGGVTTQGGGNGNGPPGK